MPAVRLVDRLNASLHALFARDPRVVMLGTDLADPYGGAFKVTRGLSTAYPDRIITTPISEEGTVGVAVGLALSGDRPIVEVMFGDFLALAFDPLVNLAAKAVSMYGTRVEVPLVLRCPVGGNRGYGPTHSQSLQKHFVGVPNLRLYEMTPFHDPCAVFQEAFDAGEPAVFFEGKRLYPEPARDAGPVDDLFDAALVGPEWARVAPRDGGRPEVTLVVPGGVFPRALEAARRLLLEREIEVQIAVPSRIHPFPIHAFLDAIEPTDRVYVAEESTAGGTWGAEVAHLLHQERWTTLSRPVGLIHSADSIIPCARHLEERVLLQAGDIVDRIIGDAVDA